MANLFTFVRPFRPDQIRSVLLVQSGPIDLMLRVGERLRTTAPGCEIVAVVREDHREAAAAGGFDQLIVVRWEDRLEVVRTLRRRRFDAIVVLLSHRGSDYLRVLPMLLRTRRILVFNENLDYFPLHATRLRDLAYHISGQASPAGLVAWALARLFLAPLATCALIASTLRLELRAVARRIRA